MNIREFLSRCASIRVTKANQDCHDPASLSGALEGCEAIRRIENARSLEDLLNRSREKTASCKDWEDFLYSYSFERQVEYACDCLSWILLEIGGSPIIFPTQSGSDGAARILDMYGSLEVKNETSFA